jgi:hypothetical protein
MEGKWTKVLLLHFPLLLGAQLATLLFSFIFPTKKMKDLQDNENIKGILQFIQ